MSKSIVVSDHDYARLVAAADADGVSPAQWIANLLIKEGRLPHGYRVDEDPEYRARLRDDPAPG